MFQPSRDDVRAFFRETWRKRRSLAPLTPLETVAADWIDRHPEFEAVLGSDEPTDSAAGSPYLHLSLHLALAEQLSIDQPPGIRALFERLVARSGDEHAAAHAAMECLAQLVWDVQNASAPSEAGAINERYLDCLRRRLGP